MLALAPLQALESEALIINTDSVHLLLFGLLSPHPWTRSHNYAASISTISTA